MDASDRRHDELDPPPTNHEEQIVMAAVHPVTLRKYLLPTPPVERASERAVSRIGRRRACCAFAGTPRFGKSSALSYFEADIRDQLPNALVLPIIGQKANAKGPGAFSNLLYEMDGGPPFRRSECGDPLLRVVRRFAARAYEARADQLVFLVDELPRLSVDELTTMADVLNKLVKLEGLPCTVVSFGTEQMNHLKSALQITKRGDLVGRFLAGLTSFDGIASQIEAVTVMEQFDDPLIADYPRGSGWSFSRFFCPCAFANGWRFSSEAGRCWNAFRAAALVSSPSGVEGLQVGADYFMAAVEYMLTLSMDFHTLEPVFKSWDDAVSESGFIDSLDETYEVGNVAVPPAVPPKNGAEE